MAELTIEENSYLGSGDADSQPSLIARGRETDSSDLQKLRLAIICDALEEGWHSMDLVGDMLAAYLRADYAERFDAVRFRPAMRRSFSRAPIIGARRIAFNADRVLNRMWLYPRKLRAFAAQTATRCDVYHIVDHSYAQLVHSLPASRTVVTCHDLDTFESVLDPTRRRRSTAFRRMTARILEGMQKAAVIACDSVATRNEIVQYNLLPSERLEVVPLGVHPACSPAPDPAADAKAAAMLGAAGGESVDILHVGSTIPRKRIDVLLKTFAEVIRIYPSARLLRVGSRFTPEQEELVDKLDLRARISVLPFLTREELAAVYRRAALVLQPSEREGFGLPVVEAMACGATVVASDLPVLRELGGGAATYCEVANVPVWRDAVAALLEEREKSPERWAARRARGLKRAAKFTWAACAGKMVSIYEELARK